MTVYYCNKSKAGKRGGGGGRGAKYLGPGLVWGAQNFDKTSGHCELLSRGLGGRNV